MSETEHVADDTSGSNATASGQSRESSASSENSNAYQKVLTEKRNFAEANKKLLAQVKELEQAKLSADGKKDELISQLQADLKTLRSEVKAKDSKYALKSIRSQVALKAKELGCVDTDLLMKAMDLDKLQVELVDDDYQVDMNELQSKLEETRKSRPFLFNSEAPGIRDGVPTKGNLKAKENDYTKMTPAQLIEAARELDKK